MSGLWKIQPASHTDHITEDGTELQRRPYPLFIDEGGIAYQNTLINRVVGFVKDLVKHEINVRWSEVINENHPMHFPLEDLVGYYIIVQMNDGNWATLTTAIESAEKLR